MCSFLFPQESKKKPVVGPLLCKNGRSKRILIVDDDSDFRWILSEALGPFAETIDAVCNGCEAVKQIKRQNYDAVLMDMHMPCKDGLRNENLHLNIGANVRDGARRLLRTCGRFFRQAGLH